MISRPKLRFSLRYAALAACVLPLLVLAQDNYDDMLPSLDGSPVPVREDSEYEIQEYGLPALGDSTSGIVSRQEEHDIGQAFLRMYRGQVPTYNDPLIHDYVFTLLNRVALHSQLDDRRFEMIVVRNPTINAFAVPGGVIGIHTGLLQQAGTEHELAGVLAHELAHLSQRHFARGVEEQQKARIPSMAALLGSLILMGVGGGDAGAAAMMATQAARLDQMLRFSRENEAEADRVGLRNLYEAGMDPRGMPDMFERMSHAMRYMGNRPPEFLLTHPVTERRMADTMSRAAQYPRRPYQDNLTFHLMKARAQLAVSQNPGVAVRSFRSQIDEGLSPFPDALQYGLALALTENRQYPDAIALLKQLQQRDPSQVAYAVSLSDALMRNGNHAAAIEELRRELARRPGNYPLTFALGKSLAAAGQHREALRKFESLLDRYSGDPALWYEIAEERGLTGNILGVHMARTEYFMLNGFFDKARQQLGIAMKSVGHDSIEAARIREKLDDITRLEEISQQL